MATTKKSTRSQGTETKSSQVLTDEEKAALKERTQELKSASRSGKGADKRNEEAVLATIAEMQKQDRLIAERIHEIITTAAPGLRPKLWYGMPAYANDGKVVCFFQAAQKFKSRYATLGFNDDAKLDDGSMWPTAFALTGLTAKDEKTITKLVEQAVS